jgi:hypothetical protein
MHSAKTTTACSSKTTTMDLSQGGCSVRPKSTLPPGGAHDEQLSGLSVLPQQAPAESQVFSAIAGEGNSRKRLKINNNTDDVSKDAIATDAADDADVNESKKTSGNKDRAFVDTTNAVVAQKDKNDNVDDTVEETSPTNNKNNATVDDAVDNKNNATVDDAVDNKNTKNISTVDDAVDYNNNATVDDAVDKNTKNNSTVDDAVDNKNNMTVDDGVDGFLKNDDIDTDMDTATEDDGDDHPKIVDVVAVVLDEILHGDFDLDDDDDPMPEQINGPEDSYGYSNEYLDEDSDDDDSLPGLMTQAQINIQENQRRLRASFDVGRAKAFCEGEDVSSKDTKTEATPTEDKDKKKIGKNYAKERLAVLRDPRSSPSRVFASKQNVAKNTNDVTGNVDFYFAVENKDDNDSWKRVCIRQRRVKPDDPAFAGNRGIIAMACPNYQGLNNGCRGHCAMIYAYKKWHMFFIWRLETDLVHGYELVTLSETRLWLNERVYKLNTGDIIFKFVSVWGFEGTHDAAFLNELDGCLNAGIRPTSVFLPLPTMQPLGDLPESRMERSDDSLPEEMEEKKTGSRRGKSRGGRRHGQTRYPDWLRSKKGVPYVTIFMMKSDLKRTQLAVLSDPGVETSYLIPIPSEERRKLGVPFPIRKFGLVTSDDAFLLGRLNRQGAKNCLSHSPSIELLDFSGGDEPVRLFVCSDEDFDKVMALKGMSFFTFRGLQYAHMTTDISFNMLPGVCVSIWYTDDDVANRFDLLDAQMIQDRYGRFFGARASVPSVGINGYMGVRYSARPRPTPALGPGTVTTGSYFRQTYNQDHLHPYLQTKVNKAAQDATLSLGRRYATYMKFVGYETCDRTIWTQGMSVRNSLALTAHGMIKNKTRKVKAAPIGFFNKPHYDKGDIVPESTYQDWFSVIKNHSKAHGYIKLREVEELVGIGLPTTCAYNFVGPAEITAYFALADFCAPIRNGQCHHFYGWAIPHCTCVPVVDSETEFTTNNNETETPSFVLAWGRSGGAANAANKPGGAVVPGSVEIVAPR